MQPTADPAPILATYRRSPHVHPYGIADVEQLWDTSTWWRQGDAVVGLLDLAGGAVVYSIADSAEVAGRTLGLLADLAPDLPDDFVITGPTGLTAVLQQAGYVARWSDAYDKLHLPATVVLDAPPPDLCWLGPGDHDELVALFATDADAGDFFHPGLLDSGHYVGRRVAGALVAVAGTHVVDPVNGVAALGNVATHPSHRGQGHGRAVVLGLLDRLRREVDVIGLNVRHRTDPARRLYRALGFEHAVTYEEAEVGRPAAAALASSSPRAGRPVRPRRPV